MRAKAGSRINFTVKKKLASGTVITQDRVFLVPVQTTKDKEPEVVGTITLNMMNKSVPEAVNSSQVTTTPEPPPPAPRVQVPIQKDFYHSIHFSVSQSQFRDQADLTKQQQLQQFVIPALNQTVAEQGLKPSAQAKWRIKIEHLAIPADDPSLPGLIRVTGNGLQGDEQIDFLRNYTGSAQKTAWVITRGIRSHVAYPYELTRRESSYVLGQDQVPAYWQLLPGMRLYDAAQNQIIVGAKLSDSTFSFVGSHSGCEQATCTVYSPSSTTFPPKNGWQKFTAKIFGLPTYGKEMTIYFSGLRAEPKGEKTWEFWGTSKANMYMSAVLGSQVMARKLVSPTPEGIIISLPSASKVTKNQH